eukprot:14820813-Heterocapsa_arctica.AAC.1
MPKSSGDPPSEDYFAFQVDLVGDAVNSSARQPRVLVHVSDLGLDLLVPKETLSQSVESNTLAILMGAKLPAFVISAEHLPSHWNFGHSSDDGDLRH